MIDSTSTSTPVSGGISTWGFVIFFLILFWFFGGGNGFGFNNRNGMMSNGMDTMNYDHIHNTHQSERDVLEMSKQIVEQNAQTAKTLADMAYAQETQTSRILEGQKDLYIKDLERIATQQFITGQTSTLTNRLDALEASNALQRQADLASVNAQLSAIQNQMLKTPPFMPYGGLSTIGCSNYSCGCNG